MISAWRIHLFVLCATLTLAAVGATGVLRDVLTDWRFSLHPRDPTGEVVVVGIDATSIAQVGVWPWPRSTYADLLTKLRALGASDIAFDVDFSSRSRPEEDTAFARSLTAADGATILPIFEQLVRASDGSTRVVSSKPLPQFAAQAWLGVVNVVPETDGRVRRYPVGQEIAGTFHPSIASLLASAYEKPAGHFLLDYGIDIRKLPSVPVASVLDGSAPRLDGKRVIVGATAIELGDRLTVPKYGVVPGVDLQALAADSMLQKRLLVATNWTFALPAILLIVLLAAVVMRTLSGARACGVLLLSGAIIELGAQAVQNATSLVIDTAPMLFVIAGYIAAILLRELDVRSVLASIAQKRFQSIALSLGDGVICSDADGRVTFWNPAAGAIFGIAAAEAEGKTFWSFVKGGREAVGAALEAAEQQETPVEFIGVRADGSEFPGEMRLSGWSFKGGENLSIIVRDITERKQSQARIHYLALHDELTGLVNRTSLCESMQRRIARPEARQPFGVILIDLDGFKEVNDKLGHNGGDALLRMFAQNLSACLPADATVARIGGDEFAVIIDLEKLTLEAAVAAISAIFGSGKRYTFVEGRKFVLSASIGTALFPGDGEGVDDLLTHADLALYMAKKGGRALHVAYDKSLGDGVARERKLKRDLQLAFEQGQFEIHYQPQVELRSNAIVGCEALLRWRHPERGLLQPSAFLAVLSGCEIAPAVGHIILRSACEAAAEWHRAGRDVCMGVNLFPSQFTPQLPSHIAQVLQETGLPPHLLEIEITENILLSDDDRTIALLAEVRALGVRVALDDFGTGFASLTHLKRFPLDRLKIDRSFVSCFGSDRPSTAIVTAIIGLARELGLSTIAEGIEETSCAELLAAAGCGEGQGYMFGRPMSRCEFAMQLAAAVPGAAA